jgi:hypothetical protein
MPYNINFLVKSRPLFDENRAVADKPSESGNNTHFQRHRYPGPDFWPEKGKNALFSRPILLETAFLSFSAFYRCLIRIQGNKGNGDGAFKLSKCPEP